VPCYHPITAWRSRNVNLSGKRSLVFNRRDGYDDLEVQIPCGQCIGCRLERSRQWAVRCLLESSLYDENCFLTLTYDDEHMPADRSLHVEHFQLFMKRLRKKFGSGIRFFHCGEYGDQFSRPHYHALIFNFDFPDKKPHSKNHDGSVLFTSDLLSDLWPFGYVLIGAVTFESAAYVSRYVTKKITGKAAQAVDDDGLLPYEQLDPITGEVLSLRPEYVTMSRRPGIGKPWLDRWHKDVYPQDYVVVNGKPSKPPKFFDSQYEIIAPSDFARIKGARLRAAEARSGDLTQDRLDAGEKIKSQQTQQLKRSFENP
jgi:hypothetical protein